MNKLFLNTVQKELFEKLIGEKEHVVGEITNKYCGEVIIKFEGGIHMSVTNEELNKGDKIKVSKDLSYSTINKPSVRKSRTSGCSLEMIKFKKDLNIKF